MSLLGRPLEILAALLTLGLPAAAVWFWTRLRGPRAARVAQRAGLLVGAQLAAVLATAVALNHIGYFYGSWSDLFRGQLTGVQITAVSAPRTQAGRTDVSPASAGHISVRGTRSSPGSHQQWARYGRLQSSTILGAASALTARAEVYFPPQYFQPAYAHTTFAGVEVLPGAPATRAADSYLASVRRAIEMHRSRPAVVVILHQSPTRPQEAQCTNVPAGPQRETFYATDVPSQVAHAFRVQPTGWGLVGEGTGGYCAVKLAMLHPRVFVAAASIDGYFSPPARSRPGDPWGGSKVLRELSDLNWRLRHMPAPPVSLLLISARARASAANDAGLAKLAGPPMTVHTIATTAVSTPPELTSAIIWLLRQLPPTQIHP